MYRCILFDLDGTLTDSKEGILNCLRRALEKMGEPVLPDETLLNFIGPPLQDSFPRFCGFNGEQTQRAIRLFKERYDVVGKFEAQPAPGLAQLCRKLNDRGYQLALASSKPEETCCSICDKFGYSPCFTTMVGSPPDVDWEKKDIITEALRRLNIDEAHKNEVLMVGDRKFDVLGARECGLDCVGVEFFGYAAPNELKDAGAVAVVNTADELEQFILNH